MSVAAVSELQKITSAKINEATLIKIVEKFCATLSDVKIKKIAIDSDNNGKKGDSYLSNVVRFVLHATGTTGGVEHEETIPIIVKVLPDNLGRRKTYRSVDFFENEFIFYNKVWDAFQKFQSSKLDIPVFNNIPNCVSSWIDGENDYIAMVNLSYEGFGSVQRGGGGLDYEHAQMILKLFAGFHGLALAFKDQQPKLFGQVATSLKETYFDHKFRGWYSNFQQTLFAVIRDAVAKELPSSYLTKFDKFLEGDIFGQCIDSCKVRGPLSVVTHGDAWAPNFLFKYKDSKPETVTMIDFQLTRYTTLVNDLSFFLFSCVDFALLEDHWDDFVKFYHQELVTVITKFGSPPDLVSLQQITEGMRAHMGYGIGMSMEALTMSLLDESEVADLDAIRDDNGVPLETVWVIHPFKDQHKRQRIASMIKLAVDKMFI